MQSWFFCIINSVFSVSRFMVCVFISLCVFVCVWDRSLRLLAVWWADQSSRRCSSWLVFLCGVVRSLSDRCCSCPVLFLGLSLSFAGLLCLWFSVTDQSSRRCSSWLVFLCGVVRSLSDRCCSCPVLFSGLSLSFTGLLCLWFSVTDQSSRRSSSWLVFLCGVVRSLLLVSCLVLGSESEFHRAALSLILCRWPEQS